MKMTKAEARKHAEELRTHARFMRSYGAAPTLIAAIEAGAKSLQDAVDAEPVGCVTQGGLAEVNAYKPPMGGYRKATFYPADARIDGCRMVPLFTSQLEGE